MTFVLSCYTIITQKDGAEAMLQMCTPFDISFTTGRPEGDDDVRRIHLNTERCM